jgi:hypothetical protein
VVFDSRLAHSSTDQVAPGTRIALVVHYAQAGTIDRSEDAFGTSYHLWTPVIRAATLV